MRLIVAALNITNDLERIGDIAVNVAERVISLRELPGAELPDELGPMASAVRTMVSKSLGALIFRNVDMATQVLESDDIVDQYRDRIFDRLLQGMTQEPAAVSPGLQFVLATRHLERIADHATNIAEDIIYWVRGLDVRHGRGLRKPEQPADIEISRAQAAAGMTAGSAVAVSNGSSMSAPSSLQASETTAPAVENFHR